jgi:hypothetical protein|tara:strand:- start:2125 stop:2436 length:312 start_codon:yes stop_codon:yes gene_type:complete
MKDWVIQVVATFIVAILTLFVFFMIGVGIKKAWPNLKYQIKFDLFKRKLTDEENEFLKECLEEEISNEDIIKFLIIEDPKKEKRAKEIVYIYDKMKREVKKHE